MLIYRIFISKNKTCRFYVFLPYVGKQPWLPSILSFIYHIKRLQNIHNQMYPSNAHKVDIHNWLINKLCAYDCGYCKKAKGKKEERTFWFLINEQNIHFYQEGKFFLSFSLFVIGNVRECNFRKILYEIINLVMNSCFLKHFLLDIVNFTLIKLDFFSLIIRKETHSLMYTVGKPPSVWVMRVFLTYFDMLAHDIWWMWKRNER